MSFRIGDDEENEIIRLWLIELRTYTQIKELTGRSLDTISRIINKYRNRNPDVGQVREVIAQVSAAKKSFPDISRALGVLGSLEDSGITIELIEQCANLLKKYPENAPAVLEAGLRIDILQEETQVPYSEIERRYRTWPETRAQIAEDAERKRALESEIEDVEALKALQSELITNQIDANELSSFIQLHKSLKTLRFTPALSKLFATELSKSGLSGEEAAKMLMEMIQEFGSTTQAIVVRKAELKQIEDQKATSKNALNTLHGEIQAATKKLEGIKSEVSVEISHKTRLEGEVSAFDRTLKENATEINLARSVMVLITSPQGLSIAQLDLLIQSLYQGRMERENGRYDNADQQLGLAVRVLATYLTERLYERVKDLEKSSESLASARNTDQIEVQRLTKELAKRDSVMQHLDRLFSRKEARGAIPLRIYHCPKCKVALPLLPHNTTGSITVKCGNCKAMSRPSLFTLYEVMLNNET